MSPAEQVDEAALKVSVDEAVSLWTGPGAIFGRALGEIAEKAVRTYVRESEPARQTSISRHACAPLRLRIEGIKTDGHPVSETLKKEALAHLTALESRMNGEACEDG